MSGAAGRGFSGFDIGRRGLFLCALLISLAFGGAAKSQEAGTSQQSSASPSSTVAQAAQDSNSSSASKTQSTSDTTEVDSQSTVPFQSHVNLVPVRVVVHDGNGKVVTDLTKEDFRLFQDRRPQTISNFSVETPASAAQQVVQGVPGDASSDQPDANAGTARNLALPSRFVALLFDDVHFKPEDLMQARLAALRFLDSSMQATERIAIFTTSGQTQVDFTDDHARIREMVTQLIPHFIGGYDPSGTSQCPPMNYYEADLIQNKNDHQALEAATDDAIACSGYSGATASSQARSLVSSTAMELLNAGDTNTEYAVRRLVEVTRRISVLPGQRTIVLVSPGFLTPNHEYDISEIIDKANRANVFINTLDGRGLYTVDVIGDITRPAPVPSNSAAMALDLSYRVTSEERQSDVLADLSNGTGGFYFHNSNDLNAGFRMTAAVPDVSYLLAFIPEALKFNGQFHSIKVTVAKKGSYTVQARKGFFAPKHGLTPEETAKQDLEEAVFSQEEQHGVPIELHLQYFKSDSVNAKLSVLTHVDVSQVRFEKSQGRNLDDLSFVAALFDRNGNFITGNQKNVELRLKDATLQRLTQTGMTVKIGFDVKPGGYIVRLVMRDSKAANLSARNGVIEIP
ncbi:MAG: VWA domain-containing protein [Candidatus Acidiferrales bacterium]